jgi:seryl-tRNA synthetase
VQKLQDAQARRNAASKEIGAAMGSGDTAKADALKAEVGELKSFIQSGEDEERKLTEALTEALSTLPNLPLDEVPDGAGEEDNVELRKVGKPKQYDFEPKQHFELGEALGLMDFEAAAKCRARASQY